jgi:transcription initiation factor TFIIH subunit 4
MLSLFVDTRSAVQMPNVMVGIITRDSMKKALSKGITANQIIRFLRINVHEPVVDRGRKVVDYNKANSN